MPVGRTSRRTFIAALGGAATWPMAASGQQSERSRHVGVLIPFSETDVETQVLVAAFRQRFQELGWTDGRNVRFDYRYTDGNPDRTRTAAAELVGLSPEVILAYANPAVSAL